ncbi:MAG TPA: Flp family type IVb pilin [Candidatus Baltobacteraceae bacterium]|nr:Flp family type IVb pilin [Candidatus Baltobacteraceae bacterium]
MSTVAYKLEYNDMFLSILKALRNDDGATMVEYGIMVALIAAICITVVSTLGKNVSNAFSTVNASI